MSPKSDVALWPTSDIRTRSPELDLLGLGKFPRIRGHVPDKQRGHEGRGRRCSVAATQEDD